MNVQITDIQRFCMHDGPGIRTTVFFSGCPLRCKWCHNPETQSTFPVPYYDESKCLRCGICASIHPEVHKFIPEHHFHRNLCTSCGLCASKCPTGALTNVSKVMDTSEILFEVSKDMAFYGSNGGITLSGGEPMAQPEAVLQLFKSAKEMGMHTALETSGFFSPEYIPKLAEYTDLFLWDYKDSNEQRHLKYTGVSNQKILSNLHILDQFDVSIVLRCILIKDINFCDSHLLSLRHLKNNLSHCVGIDLLPYHPMGESKSKRLGYSSSFHGTHHCLSENELLYANRFINI